MRFTGERTVAAPADDVWTALLDHEVLRRAIPGCRELSPVGPGTYAASLGVHVGPIGDTYRGRFSVAGHRPTSTIRVRIDGRGRAGRLELDLDVELAPDDVWSTSLRYDAAARVSGLVSRLGAPTLHVAGTHLTGCFFTGLDRALRSRTRTVGVPVPVPA